MTLRCCVDSWNPPTLIGRFKGRAIRDVSHQPPAGLPSPPPLGLLVGLRITGCPAADPLPGVTRFPRKRVRWPVRSRHSCGTVPCPAEPELAAHGPEHVALTR